MACVRIPKETSLVVVEPAKHSESRSSSRGMHCFKGPADDCCSGVERWLAPNQRCSGEAVALPAAELGSATEVLPEPESCCWFAVWGAAAGAATYPQTRSAPLLIPSTRPIHLKSVEVSLRAWTLGVHSSTGSGC